MLEGLPGWSPSVEKDFPSRRLFEPISPSLAVSDSEVCGSLRVLQFNVLADGLSGLREDLGSFSRSSEDEMKWETRRWKLLYEILQYEPDVVTLQECDHFHDFFAPMLREKGYEGVFAAKPSSACLEVSDKSDGCAVFYKRDRVVVHDVNTLVYQYDESTMDLLPEVFGPNHSLPIAHCEGVTAPTVSPKHKPRHLAAHEKRILSQNQLALILSCSVRGTVQVTEVPRLVLATTHLKALKTAEGERFRHSQARQLLVAVDAAVAANTSPTGVKPAVLITGDLNASPRSKAYESTVYAHFKAQATLGLRSALNDDLVAQRRLSDPQYADDEVWTTWKARRNKQGRETVVRHCLDYVLYGRDGLRAKAVLDGFKDVEVSNALLPSAHYPSDHIAIGADFDLLRSKMYCDY